MPIIDQFISKYIDAELIRANKEREAKHKSSGKLSASMLYQPVRWQLLKNLGAPRKEFEAYTLAKFKRGRDVEDWYVEQLRGAGVLIEDVETIESLGLKVKSECEHSWEFVDVPNGGGTGNICRKCNTVQEYELLGDRQPLAEYRECIGYTDSVINTDLMQAKKGIIPNEIKSVTNMKMKRIKKTGIDWHYKIQACLYALAMGTEYYAVTIISAEDLRTEMQLFKTREMKRDVDRAISEYAKAMENWKKDHSLPKFEANEHVKWTGNIKYAMFLEEWVEDSYAIKELEKLGV